MHGKNYSIMSDARKPGKSNIDECTLVCDEPIDKMLSYPSFESVLFMGVEIDLVLFNMLNFSGWYFVSGNYVVSALVTYIFYGIVRFARELHGPLYCARFGLLDERFVRLVGGRLFCRLLILLLFAHVRRGTEVRSASPRNTPLAIRERLQFLHDCPEIQTPKMLRCQHSKFL